jgi:hypothetical protein
VSLRRHLYCAAVLVAAACSQASTPAEQPRPKPPPRPSGGPSRAPTADPTHSAAPLRYRPSAAERYSLQRQDSLALELPGGATQVQQSSRTAYLTLTIGEGPGAYHATIRLDSLRQDVGGTMAADSVLRAEGTSWTASLTPEGRLGTLQADRTSGVGDQVEASLLPLFPVLPASGLDTATQWSDTTDRAFKADAFDVREHAVTSYTLEKREGPVYTISAATVFQRTGTGGQATQPMEMTSSGARHAVYRFSRDGGVLAGEGADSAEMTISIPAVGQSVPVHQRASWKAVRSER